MDTTTLSVIKIYDTQVEFRWHDIDHDIRYGPGLVKSILYQSTYVITTAVYREMNADEISRALAATLSPDLKQRRAAESLLKNYRAVAGFSTLLLQLARSCELT